MLYWCWASVINGWQFETKLLLLVLQGQMVIDGIALSEAKLCSQCNQLKPASDYHIEARNSDGLTHKCKDCRRLKQVFSRLRAFISAAVFAGGRAHRGPEGLQEVQ